MEDKLTDEQWATIQPLIPKQTGPGKPRADDRETLDAILYVLSTGCRWENLRKTDYNHHYTTVYRRLNTSHEIESNTRQAAPGQFIGVP